MATSTKWHWKPKKSKQRQEAMQGEKAKFDRNDL